MHRFVRFGHATSFLGIASSACTLAAALLLHAPLAQAQSDNQPSAALDASTSTDDGGVFGDKTDVTIGMGAGLDQRYMGGRDFRPLLVPMFNVSRGIFFVDGVRGAGIQYQSKSGFYIGDAFNYDQGRDNRNDWLRPGSNYLKNMGSVKGTFTNTLTLSQQVVSWLSVNGQAEIGLDGHQRGNQYQLGLESVPWQRKSDSLTLDFDVKIGDAQYNQTYFGVSSSQSRSSGFAKYSPGFGIYAYSLSATWDHHFDKHWTGEVILSGNLYPGKVADSDVVQQKYGLTVLPSLSYAF